MAGLIMRQVSQWLGIMVTMMKRVVGINGIPIGLVLAQTLTAMTPTNLDTLIVNA